MSYFSKLARENEVNGFNKIYNIWLSYVKNEKAGYFTISNGISTYLPFIKTPAINLYLYYCLRANNEKGDSFASIERIASDLNVSKKTINNWNSTLINLGLIWRTDRPYSSSNTQLLPTSDFIIDNTSEESNTKVINSILVDQLGYNKKIKIAILFLKTSPVKYSTYELYTRDYEATVHNDESIKITRYVGVTISENEKINTEKINFSPKADWTYFDPPKGENTSLNLITTNKDISDKDLLGILKDLESKSKIEKFKKVYPRAPKDFTVPFLT